MFLLLIPFFFAACKQGKGDLPVVGFADAFEDSTIKQARDGFLAALKEGGFSEEDQTMELVYRNAQGDIPTLTQIIKYFISEEVTLIAACPTLPTITALQNTRDIPVFMMVAPTPELMKVKDAQGNDPPNLFGAGENLDYIDTSFAIIPKLVKPKGEALRVGLLYNQSEPQSVEAYLRINGLANRYGAKLVARPVNSTADVKLVAGALLNDAPSVVGLIPDGIHVHPAMVKLAWIAKGSTSINLVSDAMAALGMPPGRYQLNDFDVHVSKTDARLADGTLAGSILPLDEAVRNLIEYTGCSLSEALATVTTTPAALLGLSDQRGRIAPGLLADLVLLTPDLEVAMTISAGQITYKNQALETGI